MFRENQKGARLTIAERKTEFLPIEKREFASRQMILGECIDKAFLGSH